MDIIGKEFKVLNDGFIRVVDVMGDDSSIVQAARVSYGKGTKTVSDDRGLIRYLMRNWHTTPFEMCELKLHIRVPMDCWRQWIRHRMASVNEYSTRYSEAIDSNQTTSKDEWRVQSKINKQGSEEGKIDWPPFEHTPIDSFDRYSLPKDLYDEASEFLSSIENSFHATARNVYEERLKFGVAREQARKDLPLSTYTEAYWKIDLHNLFHFLRLRMDSHAQKEIRDYATIIGNEIVANWVPIAWEAFQDYRLNSIQLTALDIHMIQVMNAGGMAQVNLAEEWGWTSKKSREGAEFLTKIDKLGIRSKWKQC